VPGALRWKVSRQSCAAASSKPAGVGQQLAGALHPVVARLRGCLLGSVAKEEAVVGHGADPS
jgi:hypothetical protein